MLLLFFMVALWNIVAPCVLLLFIYLSIFLFFPRLISAGSTPANFNWFRVLAALLHGI